MTVAKWDWGPWVGDGCALDSRGYVIERLFDPSHSWNHQHIPDNSLLYYDYAAQVCRMTAPDPLELGHFICDKTTLVVRISGTCLDNGKTFSRANWDVYFGPDSPYNNSGPVPRQVLHSLTGAEIEALWKALELIRFLIEEGKDRAKKFYIMTNSKYLINTMTVWIHKWVENGGVTADGMPAMHFAKLNTILAILNELEHDFGVQFKFWYAVPNEENGIPDVGNMAIGE
ncbi:hypothetical protein B0H63DRAFT_515090 [Podospora didyma]|uniref:ribonuclease H n=1 Tax=Podospora didyma TaxID=330526 RepID=A0AAE0K335_9PEZI|nr:hypothetical protein B0H63DRAFT_515090 [Podospora didyma]